jgi:hypothetical protein
MLVCCIAVGKKSYGTTGEVLSQSYLHTEFRACENYYLVPFEHKIKLRVFSDVHVLNFWLDFFISGVL